MEWVQGRKAVASAKGYHADGIRAMSELAFRWVNRARSMFMKMAMLMGALCTALILCMTVTGSSPKKGKGKLRHVVGFKFKETTSSQEIQRVEDAFAGLKSKIPQIQAFEWGINNSPEGLNKGCTHGFILTFNTEKDRDAYLVHPDHVEFGKLVKPVLADVFVIDFWNRD